MITTVSINIRRGMLTQTLLTQLGGAYVLSETGDVLYEHLDTGILTYVDLRRAARYLDLTLVD